MNRYTALNFLVVLCMCNAAAGLDDVQGRCTEEVLALDQCDEPKCRQICNNPASSGSCVTSSKCSSATFCTCKTCGCLAHPSDVNGNVSYSSEKCGGLYVDGTVATILCPACAKPKSTTPSRCTANYWNAQLSCIDDGCLPLAADNGERVTYSQARCGNGLHAVGTVANVTCGTPCTQLQTAQATCLATGKWSATPHCVDYGCPVLAPDEGVEVAYPSAACPKGLHTVGSVVNLTCSTPCTQSQPAQISCLSTSKWSTTTALRCVAYGCAPLSNATTDGSKTVYSAAECTGNGLLPVGTVATTTCSNGCTAVQNAQVTCLSTGKFSATPSCAASGCKPIQVGAGYTVTYSKAACSNGRYAQGVVATHATTCSNHTLTLATCQSDFTWFSALGCDKAS